MTAPLRIRVHGTPAGQGSKSYKGRWGGKPILADSNEKALIPWRDAVRSEAQRALEAGAVPILEGPIRLRADVLMPRPKAHFRGGKQAHLLRPDAPLWCSQTPDIDKVARSICDALTDAGVWRDDKQVADLRIRQLYALIGESPGALITISPL